MAIDVTAVVLEIGLVNLSTAAVALAVLLVMVLIKAFHWLRMALVIGADAEDAYIREQNQWMHDNGY